MAIGHDGELVISQMDPNSSMPPFEDRPFSAEGSRESVVPKVTFRAAQNALAVARLAFPKSWTT
jgi:hypothetical protein